MMSSWAHCWSHANSYKGLNEFLNVNLVHSIRFFTIYSMLIKRRATNLWSSICDVSSQCHRSMEIVMRREVLSINFTRLVVSIPYTKATKAIAFSHVLLTEQIPILFLDIIFPSHSLTATTFSISPNTSSVLGHDRPAYPSNHLSWWPKCINRHQQPQTGPFNLSPMPTDMLTNYVLAPSWNSQSATRSIRTKPIRL